MISRFPQCNLLLSSHSQFSTDDPRLNHEAMAILLKHTLKDTNSQTFVLGGSEDLRVLLSRLKLSSDGDEAFILMRPYIHCMAIYIRKSITKVDEKIISKTHCFIFDSQNWGLRYYPTRNMIVALNTFIPDAEIVLSGTEVQSQAVQVGCIYYSLNVLNYCAKLGGKFLAHVDQFAKKPLGNYPKASQLIDGSFPSDLLETMKPDDFAHKKHKEYLQKLEELLCTHYLLEDGSLDHKKIAEVVSEMQGLDLPHRDHALVLPPLYNIQVDRNTKTLKIQFCNKDLLTYGNVLAFSSALYPMSVTLERSKFLLQDQSNISVTVDKENNSLTYQSDKVANIEQAFADLLNKRQDLFNQHMRQQLALQGIVCAVEEEFELTRIKHYDGGFDQRQVQLALKYLLKDQHSVYVPSYTELSGHMPCLPLTILREQGYQQVVFSLNVDPTNREKHQVAVCVDLSKVPFEVSIFDSQYTLSQSIVPRLQDLFRDDSNNTGCAIKKVNSPFPPQNQIWSCGLYAILHCRLYARSGSDQFQTQQVDEHELARQFYRAYKYQEKLETVASQEAEYNDRFKRRLLDILENLPYADLKQLTNFMQIELWGNLCRDMGSQRPNNSDEYRRTRAIEQTREAYNQLGQAHFNGKIILMLAQVFQDLEHSTFEQYINQGARIVTAAKVQDTFDGYRETNWSTLLARLAQAINGEINSIMRTDELLRGQKEQSVYLKNLMACLLKIENPQTALVELFKLIDCEYYNNNKDFKAIHSTGEYYFVVKNLLERLAASFINRKEDYTSENILLKKQQAIKESQQAKVLTEVKLKLAALIPEQPGTFYLDLCSNYYTLNFIRHYINEVYLQELSEQKRIEFLSKLPTSLSASDFNTALRLYPSNNMMAYINSIVSKITLNNLTDVIYHLSEKDLPLILLKINKSLVPDINSLADILMKTALEKAGFVAAHFGESLIKGWSDLRKILVLLPVNARIAFATRFRHRLHGNNELRLIREEFPQLDTLSEFAYRMEEIVDATSLEIYLSCLPEKDRLACARQYLHLLNVSNEKGCEPLKKIFTLLSEDDSVQLCLQLKKGMNIRQLSYLRMTLPILNKMAEFAYDINQIQTCYELEIVLASLSSKKSECLPLAMRYRHLVNSESVIYILRLLDEDQIAIYCSHVWNMIEIQGLLYHLRQDVTISLEERMRITSAFLGMIKNIHEFDKLMNCLNCNEQKIFARRNFEKIKSLMRLISVSFPDLRSSYPPLSKLPEYYPDNDPELKTFIALKQVLNNLENEERLPMIQRFSHLIAVTDVAEVMIRLTPENNIAFIAMQTTWTQEQKEFFRALFIDNELAIHLKHMIIENFVNIMTMINQGTLTIGFFIQYSASLAFYDANLATILASPTKFSDHSLSNLLSVGFTLNSLLAIDRRTLSDLLQYSDLVKAYVLSLNEPGENICGKLAALDQEQLKNTIPAIGGKILLDSLKGLASTEDELKFITQCLQYPHFALYSNVIINSFTGLRLRWLINNGVVTPEHFACLDQNHTTYKHYNLENITHSPQKFGENALRDLFAVSFTFADLFHCESTWNVHRLLEHATTIRKHVDQHKMSGLTREQIQFLLSMDPDVIHTMIDQILECFSNNVSFNLNRYKLFKLRESLSQITHNFYKTEIPKISPWLDVKEFAQLGMTCKFFKMPLLIARAAHFIVVNPNPSEVEKILKEDPELFMSKVTNKVIDRTGRVFINHTLLELALASGNDAMRQLFESHLRRHVEFESRMRLMDSLIHKKNTELCTFKSLFKGFPR